MDVQGFIEAISSPVFKQWENAKHHDCPWDESHVIDVIMSSDFQYWLKSNPEGTIDQYYNHLCELKQYRESPEYKIKQLNQEVNSLTSQLSNLEDEIDDLKEEICEKEESISSLRTTNYIISSVCFVLLIILLYKFLKKK